MTRSQSNLLRGALDLLILKALSSGPAHGYGVLEWLERTVGEQVLVEEGTLYPALHRLEDRGWIRASWGVSENNRRAKFYELTGPGRERLAADGREWAEFARAVMGALGTTGRG
jgi:transcriptional regulator